MALKKKVVSPEENSVSTEEELPKEETVKEVVVKAQAPAPAVSNEAAMPTISSLKDKWPGEEVGNDFPSIKGTNGTLMTPNFPLGEWVDVQVYSWHVRSLVAPVANNGDDEARYFCRPSYDGVTIPGRDGEPSMTIKEYTDSVSDEYEEFKTTQYIDVMVTVFSSEKNSDKVSPADVFQIQVAPMGQSAFKLFIKQSRLATLRGMLPSTHQNCMRIEAVPDKNKAGKDFVRLAFTPIPIDLVDTYTPIPEPD